MSYTVNAVEVACREFPCGYCGASPGEPCTDPRRRRHSYSHAVRFDAAVIAGRLPLAAESSADGLVPVSAATGETGGATEAQEARE